jgi:hypothetical protein
LGILDCPVKPGNDPDRVNLIVKCSALILLPFSQLRKIVRPCKHITPIAAELKSLDTPPSVQWRWAIVDMPVGGVHHLTRIVSPTDARIDARANATSGPRA